MGNTLDAPGLRRPDAHSRSAAAHSGPAVGCRVVAVRLRPPSIGQHVIDVYWVFNALHYDGLIADREQHYIPAGETLFRRRAFEVMAGNH
jgi:hypothetical protein